jgi:hypothetical protein
MLIRTDIHYFIQDNNSDLNRFGHSEPDVPVEYDEF